MENASGFKNIPGLSDKDLDCISQKYSLGEITSYCLLPIGYENVLFRLNSQTGDYVLRLTSQRTREQLLAEINFVNALLDNGFDIVPKFHLMNDGEYVLSVVGRNATVYDFISGDVRANLNDRQFNALTRMSINYFKAQKHITPYQFLARGTFPRPDQLLSRLRKMCGFWEVGYEEFIRSYNLDKLSLCSIPKVPYNVVIHGDLHASNFIWHNDKLVGVIDFDDCCIGNSIIELGCLIRGTCFLEHSLSLQRLEQVIELLEPTIGISDVFINRPEKFVIFISYILVYFGVVVNEPRDTRESMCFETRDFKRMLSVMENASSIKNIIVNI